MNSNRDEIKNVLGKFEAGEMDRRSFVQSLGLLGVSTFVANAVMQSPLGATKAFAAIGGPEERAWTLAKQAAAKATKKTLTVLIPTGSIGNMTPYVDKWKNELGIQLVFVEEPDEVVHTKGMQEAVAKTGSYDVMMPTAMSYPDWIESGVIYDLTDWVKQHDPELFNPEWGVVFPASHHAQLYNGRVAGLLCDGDQIGRRLVAGLVAGDQSPLHRSDKRYRLKILQNVPAHVGIQIGHHGHDAVVEAADRVPIRRGSRDLLCANQPRSAWLVDDHDLLAHVLGHFLRHDPRCDIDGACRRQWNDHPDRPVWIGRLRHCAGAKSAS